MEAPQSQSPSAPPRLCDIAAYWDVAARCSGLRDIVAVGLRGHGAMGLRASWLWGVAALGRVGGVWPCGRGVSARAHPGAPTALWGCGASWLWGMAALGLRRRRVPGSVAAAPCKRGPRAGGRGAGLGWLIRRTPRAGHRRRGAQRPKAASRRPSGPRA